MLIRTLIALGIFISAIVLIGIYHFGPNEHLILDFITKNPNKVAIKLVRNDTLIAERNPNKIMPLASTVKIIIAIEYAIQAAEKTINPDEEIPLEELDRFHVKNTDFGAHPNWLKSVEDKIRNDNIAIREIAKGMISYSSNANTEWLCQKLGLEKINNRIDSLGISDHTYVYYFVSSLFVGKEKFPNLKGKNLEDELKKMSLREYIDATNSIHLKLLTDTTYKSSFRNREMNIQKIWSDNLPSSTVNDYVELMKKLNSKVYFDSKVQQYLDEVMEGVMENTANQKWLEHSGKKGGSTAFVLTKALYATDKKGNKTELAYFINDLKINENTRLKKSMTKFESKILISEYFRKQIAFALKN